MKIDLGTHSDFNIFLKFCLCFSNEGGDVFLTSIKQGIFLPNGQWPMVVEEDR